METRPLLTGDTTTTGHLEIYGVVERFINISAAI